MVVVLLYLFLGHDDGGWWYRLVNTELLQSFGSEAWLLYNSELEARKGRIDKELEGLKKEAETVNLIRKTEQEKVAPRIYNLMRRRDETLSKNLEIQVAIAGLQRDIKRMRADLMGKGVSTATEEEEESDDDL